MTLENEIRAAESLHALKGASVAIILGTGLGIMEEAISIKETVPYAEIPGFPRSTVTSHSGRLLSGTLGNQKVLVMSGRFHLYEGYQPAEVTFPIRVFALLGIKTLFISNAAGGLHKDLTPGSTMLIRDHINFTGRNPLIGPNLDELGLRFPEMTEPYSRRLLALAERHAAKKQIKMNKGVYLQVTGPAMETAAETRMFRLMGADAIGMSTVMEVIQAVHCSMEVMAVSAITNNNDPDNYLPAPIESVIEMAVKAGPDIAEIFKGVLSS